MSQNVDVLMITYNRPEYTRLALGRLLDSCGGGVRVWLWHNGAHEETLACARHLASHPRVHRFHHSPENVGLREPTNWAWLNSDGGFLCKVDDDCLLPDGWADRLRSALNYEPRLGVIGCWRFQESDFVPELAYRKIVRVGGGRQVLRNAWVEGSGYMFRRSLLADIGPLREGESFTRWCIRAARRGHINGWLFPFIHQEHMDDPRAEHTLIHTDMDLARYMPLSARNFGARTVAQWDQQLRRSARTVQEAPFDPAAFAPWRMWLRRRWGTVARRIGLSAANW